MKYSEYKKTLPLAEKIFYGIFPKPISGDDIAKSYNVISKINFILIEDESVR